jgi:hypothetical protein
VTPERLFSSRFRRILGKYRPTEMLYFRVESCHTMPGLPDWFIVTKNKLTLVELKANGGKLNPAQVIVHRILLELGFPVHVLTSTSNGVIYNSMVYESLETVIDEIIGDLT